MIQGNDALDGAGIFNAGRLSLADVDITDNVAGSQGGGIANQSGTVSITGGYINGNTAGVSGGGIANQSGTVSITGGDINDNSAGVNGGGVYISSGALTISALTVIQQNTAGADGGGIDTPVALSRSRTPSSTQTLLKTAAASPMAVT